MPAVTTPSLVGEVVELEAELEFKGRCRLGSDHLLGQTPGSSSRLSSGPWTSSFERISLEAAVYCASLGDEPLHQT